MREPIGSLKCLLPWTVNKEQNYFLPWCLFRFAFGPFLFLWLLHILQFSCWYTKISEKYRYNQQEFDSSWICLTGKSLTFLRTVKGGRSDSCVMATERQKSILRVNNLGLDAAQKIKAKILLATDANVLDFFLKTEEDGELVDHLKPLLKGVHGTFSIYLFRRGKIEQRETWGTILCGGDI